MSEYSISPVNQGDVQIIPMEDHRHKSWREKDENNEDIRVNGQVRGNQVDHGVRGFASSSFMYEQAGMLESYNCDWASEASENTLYSGRNYPLTVFDITLLDKILGSKV